MNAPEPDSERSITPSIGPDPAPQALTLLLHGANITLAQALKCVGLVGTGGQAKVLVRSGTVQVNGTVEVRPGRKLIAGDRFQVEDGAEWTIMV